MLNAKLSSKQATIIKSVVYLYLKKKILLYSLIAIKKTNNLLKTILTTLISSIAKFIFFIKLLIANLNILLLNIKLNFFI